MDVNHPVDEVELMGFRAVDVGRLSVLFDVIGMLGFDMFRAREDKVYVKFPFELIFEPKNRLGGKDVLVGVCSLYAFFSGRMYKVSHAYSYVTVECDDCEFKAVCSISRVTKKKDEDANYQHSPVCMARFSPGRGEVPDSVRKQDHHRYSRRAIMMVFAVRFANLDFLDKKESVAVDQLRQTIRENLRWFIEEDREDITCVVRKLKLLKKEDGLDLFGDFFRCYALLKHHKVQVMKKRDDQQEKPFKCLRCMRVSPNYGEGRDVGSDKWISLNVNGFVENPCMSKCVELCNMCFMRTHMTPGNASMHGDGYYNPLCRVCGNNFTPGTVAMSCVGVKLMDSVPWKDVNGRLLYMEPGLSNNDLDVLYGLAKKVFKFEERTEAVVEKQDDSANVVVLDDKLEGGLAGMSEKDCDNKTDDGNESIMKGTIMSERDEDDNSHADSYMSFEDSDKTEPLPLTWEDAFVNVT